MALLVIEDETLTLSGKHGDCLIRLATVAIDDDDDDDNERQQRQQQQDLLIVGTTPPAASSYADDGVLSTSNSSSNPGMERLLISLKRQGISIETLAQDKQEDLRDSVQHCWISKPLPDDKAYRRVLVWESPSSLEDDDEKSTHPQNDTNLAVESIFSGVIAMAKDHCQTVEIHLCYFGGRRLFNFDETNLVNALVKGTKKWIQRGLTIHQLTIVLSRRPDRNTKHYWNPISGNYHVITPRNDEVLVEAAAVMIEAPEDDDMGYQSSSKRQKCACFIIFIILVVGVGIGVALGSNEDDSTPRTPFPTTRPPNPFPTTPFPAPTPPQTLEPTMLSQKPTTSPTALGSTAPSPPNPFPTTIFPAPFPAPTMVRDPISFPTASQFATLAPTRTFAPTVWTSRAPSFHFDPEAVKQEGIQMTLEGINGIQKEDYHVFEDVTAAFTEDFFSGELAVNNLSSNVTITSTWAVNGRREGLRVVRGRQRKLQVMQSARNTTVVLYIQDFSYNPVANQETNLVSEYLATAPFFFEATRAKYVRILVDSGASSFTTLEDISRVTLLPPSDPSPNYDSDSDSDGLLPCLILGIVLGCLFAVSIAGAVLVRIFRKQTATDEPDVRQPGDKQAQHTNTVSLPSQLPDNSSPTNSTDRIRIVLSFSEMDSAVAETAKQVLALINNDCDVVAEPATMDASAELSNNWQTDKAYKNVRVIALLTPNFVKNLACLDQLNACLLSSKQNILLPVLVEETELPKYLQLVQYHDARPGGIDKVMAILSSIMNSVNHEISNKTGATLECGLSIPAVGPCFDIFVSYSSTLRAQANAAVEILRLLYPDVKCFIDHNELQAGARWQQTLYNALDSSQVTMIILTPGFLQSTFCREETAIAALRAAEGSGAIVTLETVPVSEASKRDLPEEIVNSLVAGETLFEACQRALKVLDTPVRHAEQTNPHGSASMPMRDTRWLLHDNKMKSLCQARRAWTEWSLGSSFRQRVPIICIVGHSGDAEKLLRIQTKVLSGFQNKGLVKTVTPKEHDIDSIDSATILICALSTAFLRSSFCLNALNIGIFRNRSEGGYLIPIVIEVLDPIKTPSFVRLIPTLDATSWTEQDETHVLEDLICAAANLARANRWKDRTTLVGSCGSFSARIDHDSTIS